jgi:hypothetical protein
MKEQQKTHVRIANVSGSVFDRVEGMQSILAEAEVDAITGDWLSEINLATLALEKAEDPNKGYVISFVESLKLAIHDIAARKIKVVTNAGGFNPAGLAKVVREILKQQGIKLSVAYIEGDNIIEELPQLRKAGHEFNNLDNGKPLSSLGLDPIAANAYLGGWGIVSALNAGADIVICGRVTDAAPVIAVAAWWHGWQEHDFDKLASALIAGHLIECSNYVTGGNFPGFKHIGDLTNIGYPIVELAEDGTFVVTKGDKTNGVVSRLTAINQLVYELQGSAYVNPDVVAILDDIQIKDIGHNRVLVSGVKGNPPPKTAKVGISSIGGYAAEMHWFFTGLDINEKVELFKKQAMRYLNPMDFTLLAFDAYGSVIPNPPTEKEATVHLRVFAEARNKEALAKEKFLLPLLNNTMQTYPGATCNYDFRLAEPRHFIEYWPTLLDINVLKQRVILENGEIIPIAPASITAEVPTYHPKEPAKLDASLYGPTVTAPLGYVVYARSGDKFTNSNVGFFVRNEDEWSWLRSLLTIDKLRELLGKDEKGCVIERVEFPHVHAVHFLLRGYLGKGVASTSSYDSLGKNVAEYLRCKHVEIPKKFLDRGII